MVLISFFGDSLCDPLKFLASSPLSSVLNTTVIKCKAKIKNKKEKKPYKTIQIIGSPEIQIRWQIMLQKVRFFLIQFERQKRNWPTNRPKLLDSLPSANTSNVSPLLALWEAVYSQLSDCTLDFHRLQMMTITFWEKFLEQRDHNDTGFQIALAWPSTDPALKAYFLLTAMLMIIKICEIRWNIWQWWPEWSKTE